MDVKTHLAGQKEDVDRALLTILSRHDSVLFEAMRYTVLSGGKRFRPMLLISAGEAFGAPRATLLHFACAVELIHNYSLIHDDLPVMDNDDFRRGQPTCHRAFGEDIALLAGDALLTLAFEVMAEAPLPDPLEAVRGRVIQEIGRQAGAEGMIEGQYLDIRLRPEKVTEESYEELILKKTGALIQVSVRGGAMLGGASGLALDSVSAYGRAVGLGFQIRDDILDAAEKGEGPAKLRPNIVGLVGEVQARRRLEACVRDAVTVLDQAGLDSLPLRFLAQRLTDME